jgi:3-oxoacyl-[acyl-carrier protein] reductase
MTTMARSHDYSKYYALVCGASAGIGRATALRLAEEGFKVTVLSRSTEKLIKLVKELDDINGGGNSYTAVDLSDSYELKEKAKLIAANRDYSVIVNNNAGPKAGPLIDAEPEDIVKGISGHVVAAHILIKELLPGMKRSGYGRIINVISTSVKAPINGLGVSNTVRGAMANWAKTMAGELGQYGVTVNNVLPGFTATGRLDSLIEGKANKAGKESGEIASGMKSSIPLGRFAEPEETAGAIAFLASGDAAYINGINLPVDGGRLQSL